jgi:hypothetical protein
MPSLRANEDLIASVEYRSFELFLNGKKKDLDSALNDFCEPIEVKAEHSKDPEDIEPLLWRAWQAVTALASETPYDSDNRQKLADLVASLEKRSDLQIDGQTCIVWDSTVWRDLPVFGGQMREAWNFGK